MSRKNKTSGIDDLAKAVVANHGINGAIAAVIATRSETPERQDMWRAVLNRLRLMREQQRGF
jgi:hypothetical protein